MIFLFSSCLFLCWTQIIYDQYKETYFLSFKSLCIYLLFNDVLLQEKYRKTYFFLFSYVFLRWC